MKVPARTLLQRRQWLIAALLTIAAIVALGLYSGLIPLPALEHPDSARYADASATPVLLVAGFSSYQGVAATTAALDAAGLAWNRSGSRRPQSRKYPPRALDTVTVVDYRHLDEPGKLTLEFFNDRLFEVSFEPAAPARYAAALHVQDSLLTRDRNGRAERIDGDWRLATNVDFAASTVGRTLRTKPYAIWQDLRLLRERDDWDAKFGGIAYEAG